MEIRFSDEAMSDIAYWRKSGNLAAQKKISELIAAIKVSPFEGIGKPEQLKHEMSGKWSRRIDKEHRLIYSVGRDYIEIDSLKGHYK